MPPSEDRESWIEMETRASGAAWRPPGPILIPGLTILYHPDLGRVGDRAPLASLASGREEQLSRRSLYDRIEKSSKIRKAADLSREEIEACLERCGGDLDVMAGELEVSKRGLQRRMTQLGLG